MVIMQPIAAWTLDASPLSIAQVFTTRGYAKRGICRRVSVRVSVTLWYCIKTAERRMMQTTPHDSAMTLVC